jgi:hypothetical protein
MNRRTTRKRGSAPAEQGDKRQRVEENDRCPVCLVEFAPAEPGSKSFSDGKIILPCKHPLHGDCLEEIRRKPSCPQLCPLCRDPLPITAAQRCKNLAIERHLNLLHHVSECLEGCTEERCKMLGAMIQHARTCLGTVGCSECADTFSLIALHSSRCSSDTCRVPLCSFFSVQSHLMPILAVRLAKEGLENDEDFAQAVDRAEDFISFARRPSAPTV